MPATTYLTLKLADAVYSVTALPAWTNLYFGLSTSDPTVSGSLTGEPVIGTNAYARVAMTNNATNFASANPKLNSTAITFPTSTGVWVAGTALAFWFVSDAATAGNMLQCGALTTSRSVAASGVTLSFATSALSITVS